MLIYVRLTNSLNCVISENRQLLSKPSRALELTLSVRGHPLSPLQAGRIILLGRRRHHDPADPPKQVDRRQDRPPQPKDDDRQRRARQSHGRALVRHSSRQIFRLGRLLFQPHRRSSIKRAESPQRKEVSGRPLRLLVGDDSRPDLRRHLHDVRVDGQRVDGGESLHGRRALRDADGTSQRLSVGHQRRRRSHGLHSTRRRVPDVAAHETGKLFRGRIDQRGIGSKTFGCEFFTQSSTDGATVQAFRDYVLS